jgi:hypothetical protein
LTAGAAETLVIRAQVACSTSLTNTAVAVHADQFDPDPANNTASVTLTPH